MSFLSWNTDPVDQIGIEMKRWRDFDKLSRDSNWISDSHPDRPDYYIPLKERPPGFKLEWFLWDKLVEAGYDPETNWFRARQPAGYLPPEARLRAAKHIVKKQMPQTLLNKDILGNVADLLQTRRRPKRKSRPKSRRPKSRRSRKSRRPKSRVSSRRRSRRR